MANIKQNFQVGGALPKTFPTYVTRKADIALQGFIEEGNFCYVLTPRQMGKSSMRVRVTERLEAMGYKCVSLDITRFGSQNTSADKWYKSLLSLVARRLGIGALFNEWWETQKDFTPVSRVNTFFEELLLPNVEGEILLFIDEIDSMLSLDRDTFSTDDFFAAIRVAYNLRAEDPEYERLHFVIMGVASPADLMQDTERTPFNIGVSVNIDPIKPNEANPLLTGLKGIPKAEQLLDRILYWTSGQPYLTQKLCREVAEAHEAGRPFQIDEIVEKNFFYGQVLERESNLGYIQQRIFQNKTHNVAMLELYREILRAEEQKVPVDTRSETHLYLKLSGLVRETDNYLTVYNPIYARIFSEEWLESGFNEIRRPYATDIERWVDSGKDEDALVSGTILEEALSWADEQERLSPLESDFLSASRLKAMQEEQERIQQQEAERRRKLLTRALVISILLLIGALTATVIALNQKNRADKKTDEATELAEKESEAREQTDIALGMVTMARDSLVTAFDSINGLFTLAEERGNIAEARRLQAELNENLAEQRR
ncbi:MAG: AAA-like domain-containing protein, partial [Bacteroidota bacterium]